VTATGPDAEAAVAAIAAILTAATQVAPDACARGLIAIPRRAWVRHS
jgi:hypothetical protein